MIVILFNDINTESGCWVVAVRRYKPLLHLLCLQHSMKRACYLIW